MFVERKPPGTELIDLLDRVLDKGTVIDASQRLRLFVIDLRKMRTRVIVESVETDLGPYAEPAAEPAAPQPINAERRQGAAAALRRDRTAPVRRTRSNSQ